MYYEFRYNLFILHSRLVILPLFHIFGIILVSSRSVAVRPAFNSHMLKGDIELNIVCYHVCHFYPLSPGIRRQGHKRSRRADSKGQEGLESVKAKVLYRGR